MNIQEVPSLNGNSTLMSNLSISLQVARNYGNEGTSLQSLGPKRLCLFSQGQLQTWTEHSTLIFENLKPVEISKNIFNFIRTSLKVV